MRENTKQCNTYFWSIKFSKTELRENKGVGNNYPLPHQNERQKCGGVGDMPQGTVQSLKFHPAGEEGQPDQGGASSGRPDHSRASSELARVFYRRLF